MIQFCMPFLAAATFMVRWSCCLDGKESGVRKGENSYFFPSICSLEKKKRPFMHFACIMMTPALSVCSSSQKSCFFLGQPVSFRKSSMNVYYWVNNTQLPWSYKPVTLEKQTFWILVSRELWLQQIYMNNIIWFRIWYNCRNPELLRTSGCLAQ